MSQRREKKMLQIIISSLNERENLIITAQNKIEIMFEIHFSLSLTVFIKNVAKFDYSSLIDNKTSMTHREIIRIIYKIN